MRQQAKKTEDDKRVEISGSSSNNNEKLYYKTENNWKSALRKMKLSEMKNNESKNKSIKHIKSTTHTTIKMKVKKKWRRLLTCALVYIVLMAVQNVRFCFIFSAGDNEKKTN